MARKNPLGKIKDVAFDTIKDPLGSGQKAVGQAKGTVELGRAVAGQVTGQALSHAVGTVGAVASLVPGLKRSKPAESQPTDSQPTESAAPGPVKPVTPAKPVKKAGSAVTPDKGAPSPAAASADDSGKVHGDPVKPPTEPDLAVKTVKKAPAKKAPAAKKDLADKAPAVKKAPAAKASAAKKAPAKKAPATPSAPPATTIDAAADVSDVDVTPADIASAMGTQVPAKKSTDPAPATKAPAKKSTPSGKISPKKAPLTAAELAGGAGTETVTSTGTRGADVGTNPDTGRANVQQGSTEPLLDPATTKSVASEAETMGKAADPDKG